MMQSHVNVYTVAPTLTTTALECWCGVVWCGVVVLIPFMLLHANLSTQAHYIPNIYLYIRSVDLIVCIEVTYILIFNNSIGISFISLFFFTVYLLCAFFHLYASLYICGVSI